MLICINKLLDIFGPSLISHPHTGYNTHLKHKEDKRYSLQIKRTNIIIIKCREFHETRVLISKLY